jgi:hypothetical protein
MIIKPRLHFIFQNDSLFAVRNLFAGIVLLGTKYFGRHFSVTSKQINVNQALTSSQ